MKVTIRPLTIDDAKTSWRWRNDKLIWEYTENKPDKHITYEIELEWLKNALLRKNELRFAICAGDEGRYIGNVQLTDITKEDCQFHIFIGERLFHGKGIGTKATKLIIAHAFNELNIKEIYLKVNPKNIAAIKAYERCEFRVVEKTENELKMVVNKVE